MTAIGLERLHGQRLLDVLPELARLRIGVFREFPYLYDGSEDYERGYLATYASEPEAVVIGALAEGRVVGAATALPLRAEPEAVKAPLRAAGYDPETMFYFGESVLEPAFRGQGIGVGFFREREAAARQSGRYRHAVFCAVIRPADHPRRPAGYVPLDAFWQRRGFAKLPDVTCGFTWKDVDDGRETEKRMAYWLKAL